MFTGHSFISTGRFFHLGYGENDREGKIIEANFGKIIQKAEMLFSG